MWPFALLMLAGSEEGYVPVEFPLDLAGAFRCVASVKQRGPNTALHLEVRNAQNHRLAKFDAGGNWMLQLVLVERHPGSILLFAKTGTNHISGAIYRVTRHKISEIWNETAGGDVKFAFTKQGPRIIVEMRTRSVYGPSAVARYGEFVQDVYAIRYGRVTYLGDRRGQ